MVIFSLVCEAAAALVLTGRFLLGYGEPFGRAVYLGVFHAISAFNNAGFALWPDNLMRYVADPWICLTVAAAVIVGGLGLPVVFELLRTWRRSGRWSVLTRLTVGVTAVLLAGGTLVFLATEWRNPHTLGALDDPGKLLAAFFTAVMPRTAGFNSLDLAAMHPTSLLTTDLLMFIGGGSAGTAGGIKVTTFGRRRSSSGPSCAASARSTSATAASPRRRSARPSRSASSASHWSRSPPTCCSP